MRRSWRDKSDQRLADTYHVGALTIHVVGCAHRVITRHDPTSLEVYLIYLADSWLGKAVSGMTKYGFLDGVIVWSYDRVAAVLTVQISTEALQIVFPPG